MTAANPPFDDRWLQRIDEKLDKKAEQSDLDQLVKELSELTHAITTFALSAVIAMLAFAFSVIAFLITTGIHR